MTEEKRSADEIRAAIASALGLTGDTLSRYVDAVMEIIGPLIADRDAARQGAEQALTDQRVVWQRQRAERAEQQVARDACIVDVLGKAGKAAVATTGSLKDGVEAELAVRDATIDRLRALTYASDDGTEYEHDHAEGWGHPGCPRCWADDIRTALGAQLAPARFAPVGVETIDATLDGTDGKS